ncbi:MULTISPECIES: LysR family transcriptional regulator [Rhodobacterales]|jgi:DNA-binding transcriptional LysR family regulator|uniref:LysR family transcriptional regulator n=1 Tax=Rhodobacterales TaxID=204455 RepID=UPI00237FA821|nr:LysR family transcriptional regulator [Phaeobacter gallaeciensis]MDE4096645.1 LysR family transcriptional regulator [Phaeobacter gallaeciensis]MDE4105456.1 LysR family transcriptional regulator [Phaeobacter gallaeciensis]MDE4109912.1 LysR family transcriptional regulator [Phaeobacter gallaeciensis]MDE4114380.1 LysR family transcriptional regulator [Phaeobacter gallaeciensis]MDE4118847.1 LysR family transcriptional regulator [Phaeobacter gallaeciensis]
MRRDALTLKQLRALLAVAETGSLTAAADLLHQTPPTIHSQIKNLEGAVGEVLLERAEDGTGFHPTAVGQEMLVAAHRIEANLSHAERQILALAEGRRGHVVLGTVSTAKYFVPRLVRLLQDRIPDVEISLRVANRSEVMQALGRGEYDLAIMGRPPRTVIHRAIPLGPHPHGIVLPPDHPLAQEDGYEPHRLMQETFLSREEGSGTRILMERFIERMGEGQTPKKVEMPSNETIKQAVLAGLGIAFLSLHTVHDELASGRLALLRGLGLPVMRHWYLITGAAEGEDVSPATQLCAQEIDALSGVYLPQITL